ncbi:ABC1 family-domain-containing protein [Obelidium mucronatum]|nr:ABC1 family-domain-containing protein [Obelidium mucronatum]
MFRAHILHQKLSSHACFTTATAPSNASFSQRLKRPSMPRFPKMKKPTRRTISISALVFASSAFVLGSVYHEELEWGLTAATRAGRILNASVLIGADYKWSLRRSVVNQLKQQDDLDNGERVDELWSLVHRRSAQRMLKVFEENGGVYIKLGQHLNALVYLLPFEYTDTFKVLQDQCPPTPMKDVKQLIKDETGRDLEDLFTNFQEDPIGVASLAQVHKATLKSTNAPIAIKIQHPHLQAHAPIDTALCMYVVRAIKRVFPEFELFWLADEMAVSLPQELDFTMEANNLTTVRTNFRGDTVFFVPNVYWSTRRILVEEFVEGVKVDNLPGLHHINVDPLDVSEVLSRVFSKMLFWDGFVHCDPHPGNILIRPRVKPWYQIPVLDKWVLGMNPYNFELVLLDHGLYRSLSSKLRLDFCHLWTSLIRFDEAAIKKYTRRIFQTPSLTHPGGSGGDSSDDGAGGAESGDSLMTRLESIDPSIDPHRLFASMLTGRPWHVISRAQKDADEIGEKLTDQAVSTISVDITGGSSGGLISLRSNDEKTTIKNKFSKRKFLSALTKIMAVLPREVLLIIKTNDILRSVDRQLGVAGGTFLNSGSNSSTGDSEGEEEGDCLSHDRQEVVGNRMVRRFGWMVYYCSVAIRNERMREAQSLRAIADAWIDSLGILIRLVALETLTK